MRFLWLGLAALLGALMAALAFQSPVSLLKMWGEPCRGFCGEHTRCQEGQCRPESTAPAAKPRRRTPPKKRAKPRSRARAQNAKALPWAKDKHIPRFDPNAIQKIDANDESGRLDEFEIDQVLATLEPSWTRCIERADTRSGGQLSTGRVQISFGVNGQGRVTGVNAKAPANLRKFGIVPCVRVAVAEARFPAYRGPITRVSTHFDVEF